MARTPLHKSAFLTNNALTDLAVDLTYLSGDGVSGPSTIYVHKIIFSIRKPLTNVVALKLTAGSAFPQGTGALLTAFSPATAGTAAILQCDFPTPLVLPPSQPYITGKGIDTNGGTVLSATAADYSLSVVYSHSP